MIGVTSPGCRHRSSRRRSSRSVRACLFLGWFICGDRPEHHEGGLEDLGRAAVHQVVEDIVTQIQTFVRVGEQEAEDGRPRCLEAGGFHVRDERAELADLAGAMPRGSACR